MGVHGKEGLGVGSVVWRWVVWWRWRFDVLVVVLEYGWVVGHKSHS